MIRPPGTPHFAECLGLLALNTDNGLWHKFRCTEEDVWPINWWDRARLVQLATDELPWMGLNSVPEDDAVQYLREDGRWQHLTFIQYHLNGADDVVKFEKWDWASETDRYFTIGRPGWTHQVLRGARAKWGVCNTPFFYVAPELPDISATEVRASLRRGDRAQAALQAKGIVKQRECRNSGSSSFCTRTVLQKAR